jgi:hypothetical protein
MRTDYAAPRLKHFGNLALLVAAFAGCAVAATMPETAAQENGMLYLGVFMLWLAYGIWKYLRMPYRISLGGDERMTLRSLLGEATVAPGTVSEIATESFGYYVHFRTPGGTFVMVNGIEGLQELVAWLRGRNPALQVRGL